jgi:cysteinyl-tRNA synthetase
MEPMEVVQYFTSRYHDAMHLLNVKDPSIEPRASGHIIEQLQLVDTLLEKGYAYESEGSVYFDVERYHKDYNYGKLSGRVLEELFSTTRELEGQSGKKNSFDFALWKKASPTHIMRWPSRFSDGFPGWHLECTAMSTRYLGEQFDIHGGGMDLLFPHHECEIAQATAANGQGPARYWMHNNMITINGQKMGKSLGNFITLDEFFSGSHKLLDQAYSPMTIRFFILQAHYRSTVDFSNDALRAADKGVKRLLDAVAAIDRIRPGGNSDYDVASFRKDCYTALNDDLNTPILIAHLFDAVKAINSAVDGKLSFTAEDLALFRELIHTMVFDILGLKSEEAASGESTETIEGLMDLLLELRKAARSNKDWATSDMIRDKLADLGIVVRDGKDGVSWEFNR